MIIVSALSLRDEDKDREKERARETELDNIHTSILLWRLCGGGLYVRT